MASDIHPLVVEDVVRSFGNRKALDGAGFELRQGEFLALLGPNGAGKTTLIRSIAGRLRIDAGKILIRGVSAVASTDVQSRLGIIPQHLAIFEKLNAHENLMLFGRLAGVAASDLSSRAAWALEWTGLADRQREPAEAFSGGMKRRLNIACGILHRPEIVLLDEPTVGVDPQSRNRIWQMLAELRGGGTSILLTTHQLDEAQTVCDRIVIIDQGKTIAAGTFDQLLDASIGRKKQIVFTLSEPIAELPSGFQRRGNDSLAFASDNIAGDLEARLHAIRSLNSEVIDISIEKPTLQAVFLQLTGHELRETE